MKPPTVTSEHQVITNIQSFNEGLSQHIGLDQKLGYFRAWYYHPEIDNVGPSKVIGYQNMTGQDYVNRNDLDGKETEPVLQRWFEVLEEGTPEHTYVRDLVWERAAEFHRHISKAARFSAPKGWKIFDMPSKLEPVAAISNLEPLNTIPLDLSESEAIVQVFLMAFKALRNSEQLAIVNRLSVLS